MFCHGINNQICCEKFVMDIKVSEKSKGNEEDATEIGIAYQTEESVNSGNRQQINVDIQPEESSIQKKKNVTDKKSKSHEMIQLVNIRYASREKGDNEKTVEKPTSTQETEESAEGVRNGSGEDGDYRQQSMINTGRKQQQGVKLGRNYLLEHIREGWPYDDKFFRPENGNEIEGDWAVE